MIGCTVLQHVALTAHAPASQMLMLPPLQPDWQNDHLREQDSPGLTEPPTTDHCTSHNL